MDISKLELAKNKFKKSKYVDISQNIIDYICECYVNLNPCSYGSRIQNYVCNLLKLKIINSKLIIFNFNKLHT